MSATAGPEAGRATSSIKEAAAAAREAIRQGGVPAKLAEPKIGEPGAGVVPQAGAGAHEGERAAAPSRANTETSVTFLEDEEVAEALEDGKSPPAKPEGGEQTEETSEEQADETETPPEGGEQAEGAWHPVELPPIRDGETQALGIDVEDADTADRIRALVRGNIRREQLHKAMEEVEQGREQLAVLEDTLRVDPVNFIMERVGQDTKAALARHLLSDPEVFEQVISEFSGLDAETLRQRGLELENQRLKTRGTTVTTIDSRARFREQGRQIRSGIQRIIPEDMDDQTAGLLAKDLERDVTEYIIANKVRSLPIEELPDILGRRLALHGITADEAAERLQDTAFPPLPPGARATRGQAAAPARRTSRQPARTGKELAAQAEARRRAGAVPGGGAGIPAAGIVLPRRQGVKARIQSLKEHLLGS